MNAAEALNARARRPRRPAAQIAADAEALDRLAELVGLPEWNIRGEAAEWIESVAEIVTSVREIPSTGLLDDGTIRHDRTSPDGTWAQVFADGTQANR